jgi:cathepsin C
MMRSAWVVLAVLLDLMARQVLADLPVHCLYNQIKGDWVFHMSSAGSDKGVKCSQASSNFGSGDFGLGEPNYDVQTKYTVKLLEPNRVLATTASGEEVEGTWTMMYDEGFEVRVDGRKFFAFSYYHHANGNTNSVCHMTFPGWYHDTGNPDGKNWGCYHGQRVGGGEVIEYSLADLSTEFLQRRYIPEHGLVSRINSRSSTWKAKVYPEFHGRTLEQIHHMGGARPVPTWKALPKTSPAHEAAKRSRQGLNSDVLLQKSGSDEDISDLPVHFDWRDVDGENYVGPVQNQGMCGSCYAHAALDALESRMKILSKNKALKRGQTLSVDDVVKCSEYSQGCAGGYGYLVGKYVQDFGSRITGKSGGRCQVGQMGPANVRAEDYYYVGGYYGAANYKNMMRELHDHGPIMVGFNTNGWVYHYETGVLLDEEAREMVGDEATEMMNPWQKTTHAVVLVGWGQHESLGKYWIVKNSWGSGWGEHGYFRIERGTNANSIESKPEAILATLGDTAEVSDRYFSKLLFRGRKVEAGLSSLGASSEANLEPGDQDELFGTTETLLDLSTSTDEAQKAVDAQNAADAAELKAEVDQYKRFAGPAFVEAAEVDLGETNELSPKEMKLRKNAQTCGTGCVGAGWDAGTAHVDCVHNCLMRRFHHRVGDARRASRMEGDDTGTEADEDSDLGESNAEAEKPAANSLEIARKKAHKLTTKAKADKGIAQRMAAKANLDAQKAKRHYIAAEAARLKAAADKKAAQKVLAKDVSNTEKALDEADSIEKAAPGLFLSTAGKHVDKKMRSTRKQMRRVKKFLKKDIASHGGADDIIGGEEQSANTLGETIAPDKVTQSLQDDTSIKQPAAPSKKRNLATQAVKAYKKANKMAKENVKAAAKLQSAAIQEATKAVHETKKAHKTLARAKKQQQTAALKVVRSKAKQDVAKAEAAVARKMSKWAKQDAVKAVVDASQRPGQPSAKSKGMSTPASTVKTAATVTVLTEKAAVRAAEKKRALDKVEQFHQEAQVAAQAMKIAGQRRTEAEEVARSAKAHSKVAKKHFINADSTLLKAQADQRAVKTAGKMVASNTGAKLKPN